MRGDVWSAGFRALAAWGDPSGGWSHRTEALAPARSAIRPKQRLSSLCKQQMRESIAARGVRRRDGPPIHYPRICGVKRRPAPPLIFIEPARGRLWLVFDVIRPFSRATLKGASSRKPHGGYPGSILALIKSGSDWIPGRASLARDDSRGNQPAFLHSSRNFLRSAPCSFLASACFEHSIGIPYQPGTKNAAHVQLDGDGRRRRRMTPVCRLRSTMMVW